MRQPFGATLVAGDTWNWNVNLYDVPGGASTLKYFFRGMLGQSLDLVGTLNADGSFSFTASSVQSLTLAGTTSWQLCRFDASENRTEIARGTVVVQPDIQTAGGNFDGRSWARQTLDIIENVLAGRVGRVEREYQIAGRHVALLDPDVLMKLRADFQAIVDREMVRSGQRRSGSSQLRAAFGPRRSGVGEWNK